MQKQNHLKAHRNPVLLALGFAVAAPPLAHAHHSAAAFDLQAVRVLTGAVERVYPGASHQQIFFRLLNEARNDYVRDDAGNPVIWSVEMDSASVSANEGISGNTFPPNTVFSIALHPGRNDKPSGLRVRGGAVVKCPARMLPTAGMHCDSVEGSIRIGSSPLSEALPAR